MIRDLATLFLIMSIAGCATMFPELSSIKEASPEQTASLPALSQNEVIACLNLLGDDIEKLEEVYGTPDSAGITAAGEKYFSTMRYRNAECMGKIAYLEIDEQGHAITRVKITVSPISAHDRMKLAQSITEELLAQDAQCYRKSSGAEHWKDKNGTLLNISFLGSCSLGIEYTSDSWVRSIQERPSRLSLRKITNLEKPEKCFSTSAPYGDLKVSASFIGKLFIITNSDNFDWANVKLVINPSGFFVEGGYIFRMKRMRAGETYTIGGMRFAKRDGTRFNPLTTKPQSVYIVADTPKGTCSWKGSWE
ncbi:hypothetical protein ES702_04255 [subsurface metagenome]